MLLSVEVVPFFFFVQALNFGGKVALCAASEGRHCSSTGVAMKSV